jgi:ATPase subunit of ABC transporter with duplicated ATPase domains
MANNDNGAVTRAVAKAEAKELRVAISNWKETLKVEKEALRQAEIKYRQTRNTIAHLKTLLARANAKARK